MSSKTKSKHGHKSKSKSRSGAVKSGGGGGGGVWEKHAGEKETDVRQSNIVAAKAIADAIRTSLGPRGMDKMITSDMGDVTITNDGATILSKLQVHHPVAKMLVDVSKSQDIEAGDGTTSVTVLCGALLGAAQKLLAKGIHPTAISDAFMQAEKKAQQVLQKMSVAVELSDRESLLRAASTSLNSKVVNQYSSTLAPIAVDSVLHVIDVASADNVDLNDVRTVKLLGGTVEDTELVEGLVFSQKVSHAHGAPTRVEKAKVALLQFCLSPPKTNTQSDVVIDDYTKMDRLLREQRNYMVKLCKQIKKTGANVVLVQKSILRDGTTDLSLQLLAKLGIMVVTDIERSDISLICRALGCTPIANPDSLDAAKLGACALVEEQATSGGRVVRLTGVNKDVRSVSVLVRGSNPMVVDEAERSLHDALCVVRSLVKRRFMTPGGGAAEAQLALKLSEYAKRQKGVAAFCIREYAEALEVIPYTLAENSGLHPLDIVTKLRKRHAEGDSNAGINVRRGEISDMVAEKIVQPMLVQSSAINLATENTCMILRVDDILHVR